MIKNRSPIQRWRRRCLSAAITCLSVTGTAAISNNPHAELINNQPNLTTKPPLQLAANAPNTYIVKSGDTLWDISKIFLNQPWQWPELWHLNPQIKNPNLIYPGDVLSLVTIEGEPQLILSGRAENLVTSGHTERISPQTRSESTAQAINTIPYKSISTFIGRPSIISTEEVKSAPYLLSIRDHHIMGSSGDEVYARGLDHATIGARFNFVHIGQPLLDPDTHESLGYSAEYVGSGSILSNGDPTRLRLTETVREVLPGDKLYPENSDLVLDFIPHAPAISVQGVILAVNGETIAGKNQVVAINRGSKHGLQLGHILSVSHTTPAVADVYSDGRSANPMNKQSISFARKVTPPPESVGTLLVFKTFDLMSYALVMEANRPINIGDQVGKP